MVITFVEKALLAGSAVALIAGPLGSLVVWRRMSNFGDALGHSALLGICFAFLLTLNLYVGLICISLLMASLLASLSAQKKIASDTLISILAQTLLSVGLIVATFLEGVRVDLLGYLYGDILAVENWDLFCIVAIDGVGLSLLMLLWPKLLAVTIHPEIAQVEGVPIRLVKWGFMILLAFVFAIAIKLVGVLLITALLVIPSSAARPIAKTPEQMAVLASVLGILSVFLGIGSSTYLDWPAGPAIVVSAACLFIFSLALSQLKFR